MSPSERHFLPKIVANMNAAVQGSLIGTVVIACHDSISRVYVNDMEIYHVCI